MSVPEITTIYLSPSRKGFGTLHTAKDAHIATHMARDAVDIGSTETGGHMVKRCCQLMP